MRGIMPGKVMTTDAKPKGSRAKAGLTVSRPQLLVNGSDEQFRHFIHDTLAFAMRIQEIRNRFGEAIGLTGTQYTMLIAIAKDEREGEVGINLLAESTHFSAPFVTIEVNRLVALKLVGKTTNPTDRRRVRLTVTAKGHELLDKLKSIQEPVNNELFSSLSREDFQFLRKKVEELVGTADRALKLLDFLT
jgi:DNA-binding MarR family transcriptional regulator